MPVKTQTPTHNQINELRNVFLQKYEKEPPADSFHTIDIDRIKNADVWLTRFLEMYDLDLEVCLQKLWETCIWRKSSGANELSESNLRKDYLTDGVIFPRGKDVDGKPVLIFKTKLHTKGTKDMNEVIRVLVYWIERIHRETNMSQMTIFFDMAGTGISNMDLDFVKRIIETFKLYYPNALNYILIFEMAWVLNAAFKIIKSILPAKALEILKIITKKDINTYIDKDNCLNSWGGNDDYEFKFVPEEKSTSKSLSAQSQPTQVSTLTTSTHTKANGILSGAEDEKQNGIDKKVHFANSSPTTIPQMEDFENHRTPEDHKMLRVTPEEFITFSRTESNHETTIGLTCIGQFPIIYKIQTTAPEKFRVRPRYGLLSPNESVSVNIVLKHDFQLSEPGKDKFLVMSTAAPEGGMELSSQLMTDIWKQKQPNSSDVEHHRLCCTYENAGEIKRSAFGSSAFGETAEGKSPLRSRGPLTDIDKHAMQLEKQLRYTQVLQGVTLFFVVILSAAVVYLLKLSMC